MLTVLGNDLCVRLEIQNSDFPGLRLRKDVGFMCWMKELISLSGSPRDISLYQRRRRGVEVGQATL